jgi:hypothetical protein
MTEPTAARPYMPGYGVQPATGGRGLLPWSWAEQRLVSAHDYGTSYGPDMVDPASNSVLRLRPEWVFALDSRDFTGSPTRFTFGGDTL